MLAINDLKERLELIEYFAKKLNFDINEDYGFIKLSRDNYKVCIFLEEDKQYILDHISSLSFYNYIFVIRNDNKKYIKEEYSKNIFFISKNSLLTLKENMETYELFIVNLLNSFIKQDLDEIISLVFKNKTIKKDEVSSIDNDKKVVNVKKEDMNRIKRLVLGETAVYLKRKVYKTVDDELILFLESKEYLISNHIQYWYTLHPYQDEILKGNNSFIIFYFKNKNKYIKVPYEFMSNLYEYMDKTIVGNENNYHVHIHKVNNEYFLKLPYKDLISITDKLHTVDTDTNNMPEFLTKDAEKDVIKLKTGLYKDVHIKSKYNK